MINTKSNYEWPKPQCGKTYDGTYVINLFKDIRIDDDYDYKITTNALNDQLFHLESTGEIRRIKKWTDLISNKKYILVDITKKIINAATYEPDVNLSLNNSYKERKGYFSNIFGQPAANEPSKYTFKVDHIIYLNKDENNNENNNENKIIDEIALQVLHLNKDQIIQNFTSNVGSIIYSTKQDTYKVYSLNEVNDDCSQISGGKKNKSRKQRRSRKQKRQRKPRKSCKLFSL
jgi:hypothetical protein